MVLWGGNRYSEFCSFRRAFGEFPELWLKGVKQSKGVAQPLRLEPECMGNFGIRVTHGASLPELHLRLDIVEKVLVNAAIEPGTHACRMIDRVRNVGDLA